MQLDIFTPPASMLARSTDPKTSHEAAARVKEFHPAHTQLVLDALRRFGRAGAEQIAAATKLQAYQVRKRLPELRTAGLAELTEDTRVTASGRSEGIWRPLG